MGTWHLGFVFLNFRLLGRLRGRLHQRFPGRMEEIWDGLGFNARWDIAASPTIFTAVSDRAALMLLFVARRESIPVILLGDDEVAELVFRLNGKMSAKLYRGLSQLVGMS